VGRLQLNHSLAFLKRRGIATETTHPARCEREPRDNACCADRGWEGADGSLGASSCPGRKHDND